MTDQYLVAGEGFILVFSVTEKKTLHRKSILYNGSKKQSR